jgi:hypothetical protein
MPLAVAGTLISAYGKREEACTGLWWGNPRERDHWGDPGIGGMIMLRRIFRNWDVRVWTGLGCLRIETGGGHL